MPSPFKTMVVALTTVSWPSMVVLAWLTAEKLKVAGPLTSAWRAAVGTVRLLASP